MQIKDGIQEKQVDKAETQNTCLQALGASF